MTPDEFVATIEAVVFSSAVDGTVASLRDAPAGRGPHPRTRGLHEWYSGLDHGDQKMVAEVVRDATHAAVFGFLCVLDGVRAIDDPPHVELQLVAVSPNGKVLINDPELEDLHDRFNGLVHPPSEAWPIEHDS